MYYTLDYRAVTNHLYHVTGVDEDTLKDAIWDALQRGQIVQMLQDIDGDDDPDASYDVLDGANEAGIFLVGEME